MTFEEWWDSISDDGCIPFAAKVSAARAAWNAALLEGRRQEMEDAAGKANEPILPHLRP